MLTPKIKHVRLLVLIWERLQTPTTATTPDATVQPLGRHITNKKWRWGARLDEGVFRGCSPLGEIFWVIIPGNDAWVSHVGTSEGISWEGRTRNDPIMSGVTQNFKSMVASVDGHLPFLAACRCS